MSAAESQIVVACSCGKKLKAPATAAGKKAKCPSCGRLITIAPQVDLSAGKTAAATKPAVAAPPVRASAPIARAASPAAVPAAAKTPKPTAPVKSKPPVDDDPLAGLYDLAEQEASAAPKVDTAPRCPKCKAIADPSAVMCVQCGYNFATGKSVGETTVKKAKTLPYAGSKPGGKGKVVDAMAPQGSFMVGVSLSAAFAVGAGILWFLVAYFTKLELYFLGLVVGGAAGAGMQVGQKGFSRVGGLVAAGFTFLTIVIAKIAVLIAILMPGMRAGAVADDDDRGRPHDDEIAHVIAVENLQAKGIDPDKDEEKLEIAEEAAMKRVQKMPQDEYDRYVTKADEMTTREELVSQLEWQSLKTNGENATEAQTAAAHDAAVKKVDAMTPADRKTELAALEEKQAEEFKAKLASKMSTNGSGNTPSTASGAARAAAGSIAFLALMILLFGPIKFLFLIGSMFFAYRTASGTVKG